MNIRNVSCNDAEELLNIYAPYVLHTPVTFEYQVPDLSDFTDRVRETLTKYPYLAAQENGRITGYAYASPFKGRPAYSWSVETSIYVKADCHGQGIGSALYTALEKCLAAQNICNLCACIAYPNPESIAFHKNKGYELAAHFHSSGYKSGSWYDMVWMEKVLNPHEIPPKPFLPFPEIGENILNL